MGTLENTPFNSGIESLTILAKEVKKKNILLYGLFIQYKKVCVTMRGGNLYQFFVTYK